MCISMRTSFFSKLFIIWCLLTGITGIQNVWAETIPAASDPGFNKIDDGIKFIYSNYYGKRTDLQYQFSWVTPETVYSTEKNNQEQDIIKLSTFDSQFIAFYSEETSEPNIKIETSSINYINIDIYLSEKIDELNIKLHAPDSKSVYGYTVSTDNVGGELLPDSWHTLRIPLSEFEYVTGTNQLEQINSIELMVVDKSGGSAKGRVTAYLDNIFFYKEKNPSPTSIKAAPVPMRQSSNVKNFYSTKYGTGISMEYLSWGSQTVKSVVKDENEKDILKFSNLGWMGIQYNPDNNLLNISGKDRLHLEVYPETNISFAVKLILYEDRVEGISNAVSKEFTFKNLTGCEWNSIEVDLSEYYVETGDNRYVSVIQPSSEGATVYLDHIYFYDSKQITVEGTPDFTAYLPPVRNTEDVVSLFGDSYLDSRIEGELTFVTGTQYQTTVPLPTSIGDREVKALAEMNHIPINVSGTDISAMEFFHIDVYSEVETQLTITLIGEEKYEIPAQKLTANEWTRIDVTNGLSGSLYGIYLSINSHQSIKTFFIDNIYFYNKQTSFTPTPVAVFNNQLGRGVNIGATFEQQTAYSWSDTYIEKIKEKGFKHVRLPVRWDDFPLGYPRSMDKAPYNIKAEFLTEIQEVIDKLLAADLRVILNMHHYDTLMDLSGEAQADEIKRFMALWTQLADYFQNYDESLVFEILNEPRDKMDNEWNHVFPEAIKMIRQTYDFRNGNNKNRAIMIGTTNWGTIYGLEGENALILPENDDHLIVTIHYYNPLPFTHQGAEWVNPMYPVGLRWSDTQSERDAVTADFDKIKAFSNSNDVPIHIGEFGVHYKADIDSRLLWTNHIARTIEKYDFSSAYWHLTSSIYNESVGEYPYLPDALLTYDIPAKVAEIQFLSKEVVYDINDPKDKVWGLLQNQGGNATLNKGEGSLTIEITDGGNVTYSVMTLLSGFTIEKNATYEVSFIAKTTSNNGDIYSSYIGFNDEPYTKYGSFYFTPRLNEQTFSYTFTMHHGTDNSARIAFELGNGGGAEVTLKDITIKKGSEIIPKAPVPSKSVENVSSIYSSKYTANLYDLSDDDSALDTNHQKIILFSDFASEVLSFNEISPKNKTKLHLEIYPGSWFNITVTGNGITSSEKSYTLKPHAWNSIDIDLTDFLSRTGGILKSINLSGGAGEERRIYLDHVYLYQESVTPDPDPDPDSEEPAPIWPASAPTLHQENVVSVHSNPYENINSIFERVDGQETEVEIITIKGVPVWKLTNTNLLAVNVGLLDVSSMEYLHLDVWSPYEETLKIYLSDGIDEIEFATLPITKEKWQIFQFFLPDLNIVKYIRFESDAKGTFYLDNLYFSKDQPTGNENISDDAISYKISNGYLIIEATDLVRNIDILDVSGRFIRKESPMTNIVTIDIRSISKGVYITQVVCTNGNRKTFKFVKK